MTIISMRSPGRLLNADEVAEQILTRKVTPRWIRENLRAGRVKLGHHVFWEENTVKAWLMNQVDAA